VAFGSGQYQLVLRCSALAETLAGQEGAIFCLGSYTGVAKDAELASSGVFIFEREWRGVSRDLSCKTAVDAPATWSISHE
jgi:hypothetical protein